jgi:fatty acid desaturase
MLIECAVLMSWRKQSRRGPSASALLTNLAAGAALMLSLRAALVGSPWQMISFWLILALLGHAADLKIRWAAR